MKAYGFRMINLSEGDPENLVNGKPAPLPSDIERALQLNAEWDAARKGRSAVAREGIYVIGFGIYIKIGWSKNINQRLHELQAKLPEKIVVHARFPGTRKTERDLHLRFSGLRLRGEWFKNGDALHVWIFQGCPHE